MGLVARHLEASGMPTVILGSARDVIEHCGVPRFLFTDFPLGNPCGRPFDTEMQDEIVSLALDLLENAETPRSVVQAPHRFAEGEADETWRRGYMHIDDAMREELRQAGERRRESQRRAKQEGAARAD